MRGAHLLPSPRGRRFDPGCPNAGGKERPLQPHLQQRPLG